MSQQDSVSTVQEGREAEERTEQLADFVVPPSRLEDTTSLKGEFGAIFGSHPAGVAVITAEGPDGPVGLTASSLSSVSADPPIIGFSLQARRGSAALVAEADTLLVHLLDSSNVAIARAFATHGAPRFGDAMNWRQLPTGEPLLTDVGRVMRVEPLARIKAGPALVFNCGVLEILGSEPAGAPLVYHQRQFHSLSESTVAEYQI
ncbi:flavin reductase [Kocuria palustris]|jgi:flavin reductase (DIM6/NTAB) family NADH-FMN oxidoreductase RutF|uniref:Flavin reductase-like domain protein n=1 Tax=Kocuria palustris PEL TaxID=1236550 RepID=M2X920_9MICC|nr:MULTISPECIES: flavin reductase family protein [Kocuria]EME35631.1 flavin reductase-like domain protein [Kocuria palustris PEL]MBN6754080.1 flavin reductase [Kocuria palustris]MBN6759037.1 flavin reductase [Kocuria palustris]MBN6764183.1 flavin reductase [Kocuria palustris]MBN6783621.1 flavin reductase [Kocuria palustris]